MKTLNKKHRKFKLSLQIAAILSCVAIASVGFAGWVIVNQPENKTATGSVEAYAVSEQGFAFGELTFADSKDGIIFGKEAAPAMWDFNQDDEAETYTSYGWLVANDVTDECMVLTLTVPYTVDESILEADITIDFDAKYAGGESDGANAKLLELINNNYITFTMNAYLDEAKSNSIGSTSFLSGGATLEFDLQRDNSGVNEFANGKFYIEIKFAWGTAFKGFNPYVYFNGQQMTDELKSAAKKALAAIDSAVTQATYDESYVRTPPAQETAEMTYNLVIGASVYTTTPTE